LKTDRKWRFTPRVLNFGTGWRWVVTFTPAPLCMCLCYPLDKRLVHPLEPVWTLWTWVPSPAGNRTQIPRSSCQQPTYYTVCSLNNKTHASLTVQLFAIELNLRRSTEVRIFLWQFCFQIFTCVLFNWNRRQRFTAIQNDEPRSCTDVTLFRHSRYTLCFFLFWRQPNQFPCQHFFPVGYSINSMSCVTSSPATCDELFCIYFSYEYWSQQCYQLREL
jgi:hypothetical protein